MSTLRRHPRLTVFVVGLLTGVLTVVLVGVASYLFSGDPEGKCPSGYFPATNVAVGGDCFKNGTVLPPDFTADPGGNSGLD